MLSVNGFGPSERSAYFFLLADKTICVRCDHFAGTLSQWEKEVKEVHGDTKFTRAYLALIPAILAQLKKARKH